MGEEHPFNEWDTVRTTLEGRIITIYPDGIAWVSLGENGGGVLVALSKLELITPQNEDTTQEVKENTVE